MTNITPAALVVLRAFGKYGRGDLITDPNAIRAILDGGNSSLVVVPALPAAATGPADTSEH